MIFVTWKIILVFFYVLFNFLMSIYIYKNHKKFGTEKLITDPETNKKIDVHKLYPEFIKDGHVGFLRIFFGLIFLFWIRFIICLTIAFQLGLLLQ